MRCSARDDHLLRKPVQVLKHLFPFMLCGCKVKAETYDPVTQHLDAKSTNKKNVYLTRTRLEIYSELFQYLGAVGTFCASGAKLSASASRQIIRQGCSVLSVGCWISSMRLDMTLKAL